MKRGLLAVAIAGALIMGACSSGGDGNDLAAPAATPAGAEAEAAAKTDTTEFKRAVRVLWEDHVAWTRLFIVSAVAGLPDTEATAERLLKNQDDIGNAVAQYYGEDAGKQLATLLRSHIAIAGDLVTAAKAGDNAKVTAASDAWYTNADEIAAFLASANPAWPEDTVKTMMRGHLDQTLREATAQLTGDYKASVTEYDRITTHILEMADALSNGIVTQFPDRFTK